MSDDLFGGDSISIDVYYTSFKNKNGFSQVKILPDDEALKMLADEKTKDNVKKISTTWIQQTWHAANELLRRSTMYNQHTHQQDIDWTAFRDARIKACMQDWDAKDKDGNPVPCNGHTIDKLHASIAMALLDRYDKATSIDQETETKN